jgi:hypothetical protein
MTGAWNRRGRCGFVFQEIQGDGRPRRHRIDRPRLAPQEQERTMLEISGIGGLIILVLDIWALVSIIGSSTSTGKKVLWCLLVLILPVVGFLIWLIAGPRSNVRHA